MIRGSIWRTAAIALMFGSLTLVSALAVQASPPPSPGLYSFLQTDDDGDGIPNDMDPDDDNDGIPDADEGDPNAAPSNIPLPDSDGDGITNDMDPDDNNNGVTDEDELVSAPSQPSTGSAQPVAPADPAPAPASTSGGSAPSSTGGPLVRSLPVTGRGTERDDLGVPPARIVAASFGAICLASGLLAAQTSRSLSGRRP